MHTPYHKVKSSNHPQAERAGPIASDSLAAESYRQGGGFSENRGAEPLGVKGSSSNFANTDTSGATTLPPARDAAERDANTLRYDVSDDLKGPGGRKYPEALGGQVDVPQRGHGSETYSGESTEAKQQTRSVESGDQQSTDAESNRSGNQAQEETGRTLNSDNSGREIGDAGKTSNPNNSGRETGYEGKTPNPDDSVRDTGDAEASSPQNPAPGYATYVASSTSGGKPKGKDLTEGGFDDDPANNSSFNPDVDSENDPGREAIKHFQEVSQAASGNIGPVQKEISGDGQYDALESDEKL